MSGDGRRVPTIRIVCSGFDGQVGQAVMEATVDPGWLSQVRANKKEDAIVSYYIRPLVHDFMQTLAPTEPMERKSIA